MALGKAGLERCVLLFKEATGDEQILALMTWCRGGGIISCNLDSNFVFITKRHPRSPSPHFLTLPIAGFSGEGYEECRMSLE